jgi:hypothetical protein
MLKFEDCIESNSGKSVYEWLINQDHIPFDMSSDAHGMYWTFYQEFLKDIQYLYYKTGSKYYWYSKGKLVHDEGDDEISGDSIKIIKEKLRSQKIDFILSFSQ